MTTYPLTYRDCEIQYQWPTCWVWAHVEYTGPEDRRCGFGRTIEDCIREIDERYQDDPTWGDSE